MPMIQDDHLPRTSNMRVARSAAEIERIKIKNRRKRYLDLHPEYFGPDLELADPLLYDRLIRRFQSASEREAEGRKKGYSGVLEADLARSEAKLDALHNPSHQDSFTYSRDTDGRILTEERDEVPVSKEEGLTRWRDIMEQRFLSGQDTGFNYTSVDASTEYDDTKTEERDAQDQYFDGETPEFVRGEAESVNEPQGETGIQDF